MPGGPFGNGTLHPSKAKPKARSKPVGVFAGPIKAPSFRPAQHRATRKVVRAQQRVPAVKIANRNITRLAQRENPQYRKNTNRDLNRVKATRDLPARLRRRPNPKVKIVALKTLTHGPAAGRKTFGNSPDAAWVNLTNGVSGHVIHVTPATVHDAFAGSRLNRLYARETPIHELAHVYQRDHLSTPRAEGGAEAFMWHAARDIGLLPVPADSYRAWARQLELKHPRFVTRGQFK